MILDTHFHAFPGRYLDLVPEAQNDVRGVGFHAFGPIRTASIKLVYDTDKEKIYHRNAETLFR